MAIILSWDLSAVTGFTRLWSAGIAMIEETNHRGSYVLFQRSNQVSDDRTIEASAKIAWRDLLGLHGQAELNRGGFRFDLNATAWVSHSGCKIPNTGGATESTAVLSFTCKDVIQIAKSILTTGQPGRTEIALLAPYR